MGLVVSEIKIQIDYGDEIGQLKYDSEQLKRK